MYLIRGIIALLFVVASAAAITIDNFDGSQLVVTLGGSATQSSSISDVSAIGGARGVVSSVNSGTNLVVLVDSGLASISFGNNVTGRVDLRYDGDADATQISSSGLVPINLTADGSDSFKLEGLSFDHAGGNPLGLSIKVYDANFPNGSRYSTATHTLNNFLSNADILIPFSGLTAGPNGGASLTAVGAIEVSFVAATPAFDLSISRIGTNGGCAHVPVGGVIYDQCGVCGGDNSSCADCLGVPGGAATPGSSCIATGVLGICASSAIFNAACQCVPAVSPSSEACDGFDNDCDGAVDETDVCALPVDINNPCVTGSKGDQFSVLRRAGVTEKQKISDMNVFILSKGLLNDSRRYTATNEKLYRTMVAAVNKLPRDELNISAACTNISCARQRTDKDVARVASASRSYVKLAEAMIKTIRRQRSTGVCEGDIATCRLRIKLREKQYKSFLNYFKRRAVFYTDQVKKRPATVTVCSGS